MSLPLLILLVFVAFIVYREFNFEIIKDFSFKLPDDREYLEQEEPIIDYSNKEFICDKTNYFWEPIMNVLQSFDSGGNSLFDVDEKDKLIVIKDNKYNELAKEYIQKYIETVNRRLDGVTFEPHYKSGWEEQREELGLTGNLYYDYRNKTHKIGLIEVSNVSVTKKLSEKQKTLTKVSVTSILKKTLSRDWLQITIDFLVTDESLDRPVIDFINVDGFYTYLV